MTDSIGPDPVAGGAVGDDADDAPDRTVLDREERAARQLIMTLGSKPEPTALSEDEAAREGTAHEGPAREQAAPLPTPRVEKTAPEVEVLAPSRALVPRMPGVLITQIFNWNLNFILIIS